MATLREVTRTSLVKAPPDVVWERVTSPEGISHELRPWLRMTIPARMQGRTIADVKPPEKLGRSWILAGGIVPVDFDNLRIVEIGERSFQEHSTMLTMSVWRHHRRVEAEGEHSRVTDHLEMCPRWPLRWIPGFGPAYAFIVARLFAHRHRRLRRWGRRSTRRRRDRVRRLLRRHSTAGD